MAAFETASGLNFRVGRIDGSIYGRMVLTGVQVRDPKGAFLTAPRLVVDWRPFAYIHSKIDVKLFQADSMQLLRNKLGVTQYLYKPHTSLQKLLRSVTEVCPLALPSAAAS